MSTKCVILRFFFTFCSKVAHVHQHVFTFLAEQLGQNLRALWDGKLVAKLCFSLFCSQSTKLIFFTFKYGTQKKVFLAITLNAQCI